MLFTLSTSCLRPLLLGTGTRKPKLDLMDVPRFARDQLGLHGLTLSTDLLAGASRRTLEALRERADKAACACLVLIESEPQPFGSEDPNLGDGAVERTERVIQAAHILGCNAAAVQVAGADDATSFENATDRLKVALERAERLELNLLISPTDGLTNRAERVTELIKAVGRFRMMTFPDFERAAKTDNPVAYLRRLTPYAGAVCASTVKFTTAVGEDEPDWSALTDRSFEHEAYPVAPLIDAVQSVGFDGALAIEYRGRGDVTLGLLKTRAVLEAALYDEPAAAVDDDEDEDLSEEE
ncbi:MAG: sugar phosphate isomerase/epimerase [Phycisphaeraceae bacterium]|nr:sugar phosphate isomerase/epimerase [Phycisphaeraceae bacterium]MCW5754014.1 sugar phosphate isomerase/epimerase [Phycisphaeraceae bacterium]